MTMLSLKPSTSLYKADVIQQRRPWCSFEPVEFATLGWVDWFNNRWAAGAHRQHPAAGDLVMPNRG